jgi:CRISPR-associated DxTHG motif protein
MIIVTALGTGDYKNTKYVWGDYPPCETNLFPVALAKWLKPSEMRVLLTPVAKEHPNWKTLQSQLKGKVRLDPIDIPQGGSEEELWALFSRLTQELPSKDEVVLDITHGFRSLPFVAMLAATFLRIANDVKIRHIVYGAFEAKDEDGAVPVFDLTPLVELLEWASATDRFLATGDARRIAEFLEAKQDALHRSPPASGKPPTKLQSLAGALRKLSEAEATAQARQVTERAASVVTQMDNMQDDLEYLPLPFKVLTEKIRHEAEGLAWADGEKPSAEALDRHLALLKTYSDRGQVIQGLLLAREWVVSKVCVDLGKDWIRDRDHVENALNVYARTRRSHNGERTSEAGDLADRLRQLPYIELLRGAWDKLVDPRNSVAHCGMKDDSPTPERLRRRFNEVVQHLEAMKGQHNGDPA